MELALEDSPQRAVDDRQQHACLQLFDCVLDHGPVQAGRDDKQATKAAFNGQRGRLSVPAQGGLLEGAPAAGVDAEAIQRKQPDRTGEHETRAPDQPPITGVGTEVARVAVIGIAHQRTRLSSAH